MAKLNCNRIMKLRLATGMRITSLANEIDISPRMLMRMETEPGYNPGVFTMLKVSEFFKVRLDDLVIKD